MNETNRKHTLTLNIAGFVIQLRAEVVIKPEAGYRNFIVSGEHEPDILVECRRMMDNGNVMEGAVPVFSSASATQKFYDVYRRNDELLFAIHDQQHESRIQQYALLDGSMKHWTIWSAEKEGTLDPLAYPMGPVLLHYACLTANAVMMHASGVFDGTTGRLFSGFSGAGKSTISNLWKQRGNQLINDDRLIIRREDNRYFIHNTPMFYRDEQKNAPLDAVYLIHHAPENILTPVTGAAAVTGIMAFSIQNNYDPRFVQHHLDFFTEMCVHIPVYRLGFVPDESVVDFCTRSSGFGPFDRLLVKK